MSVTFVDAMGLTRQPEELAEYVAALGLPGDAEWLTTGGQRLALLARLREGAGVTVYTGPFGAAFWLLASVEVKVRLVPDGTDFTERIDDMQEWGLRAQGVGTTPARLLVKSGGPKTRAHGLYAAWGTAKDAVLALAELQARGQADPLVVEAFPSTVLREPEEQFRFLASLDRPVSSDWEWEVEQNPGDGIGLAVSDETRNVYLPLLGKDYPRRPGHLEALREAWKASLWRIPHTLHNGKADYQTQYPGDPLELSGLLHDDTIVMAYLAGDTELALKAQTRARLGRDPLDYPEGLENLPVDLAARYAAAGDTRNTFDLRVELAKVLAEREQTFLYEEIERPLVPVIASMEQFGAPISGPVLTQLGEDIGQMAAGLRAEAWARYHLDIANAGNKNATTRAIVERMTGYDPGSVSKDALAKVEDPWMDTILGFRQLRHRKVSFIDKHLARWAAAGKPDEFYGYVFFNQAGSQDTQDPRSFKRAPRSGRLSSSGDFGNFQNQPGDIRGAFIAPPGCKFWSLDYSGLELHIAASYSRDPTMMAILSSGCADPGPDGCPHKPKCGDLHDAFRYRILEETKVDVGRTAAKQGNFNAQYGGSADMLRTILAKQRAHVEYEVADLIVQTHRQAFAGYHAFGSMVTAMAQMNGGWSQTMWGRRRYDADLFSFDRTTQGHAERALINHTIQGTAADILKMAMVWAVPILRHYGAHLSMQVHDELCGWVREEVADEFVRAMKALMENVQLPGLSLKVEGGAGVSWKEAH